MPTPLAPRVVWQSHLYFIFMELASGGELFDQVIDRGANAMSEDTARNFMRQLLVRAVPMLPSLGSRPAPGPFALPLTGHATLCSRVCAGRRRALP